MQPTHNYVRAVGNRLEIDGQEFKFVGFNIRGLAHYGFNDILPRSTAAQRTEVLAAAQAAGSLVVRIFLPFFTLSDAELISRLRIVLDNAVTYQQRVIVCLTDHFEAVKLQHWSFYQDPPEYKTYLYIDKHWNKVLNPDFYARLYKGPFLDYVRKVVTAFRNHPAVFAWELTNESSNYPDHDGFINFCNSMAAEIRAIDPDHMITAGIVSTAVTQFKNEPGNDEPARFYENLDFVTIHDYDTISLIDLDLARRLNKPLVIEETGRPGRRANFFRENMAFWFDNGACGYIGWGFMPSDFDNQDGDANIGIDRVLHGDYEEVTQLWIDRAATFPPVPPPAPMTDTPGEPPVEPPEEEPVEIRVSASHNNVLVGADNLSQALDGRPETRWSTRALQQPGMWFEIDLNEIRSVSGLALDTGGSPQDYPRGYVVYVAKEQNVWEEVARNDHNEGALDISFSPHQARYIRIEQTGSADRWWWSIYEIDISDEPPVEPSEEEPVEIRVSASHNNVLVGTDNLSQALDGHPETRWSTQAVQQPGMWFEIDLGQVQLVSQIALNNDASPNDYPRGYIIRLSADHTQWEEVARNDHNEGALDISFSPHQARYIRIEQTGSADRWWWSIYEIDISDEPPVEPPEEEPVEIRVSASHNNVLVGADNLSQALDGRPETRWSTRALQQPGMWFEIDLNEIRSVSGLALDTGGSPQDYPRGYVVYVAKEQNVWEEVARNDHNEGALDISFSPHQARYIRIEQTGSADRWWWSIYEIDISDEPPVEPSEEEPVEIRVSASHNNVLVGTDNLSQALDGHPETRWSTQAVQQPGMWFEIDLGQVQLVSQIALNNDASPNDYPRGYIIRLSADHTQWEEVARNDHNEGALDISFNPHQARYIRIEQTGSADRWWWSIYEFTINSI